MEHELTHLPYRSWCPVCVRSKGRADNHPKQHSQSPVIQVDINYYKAMGETKVTPILTAVDVETGMCMAVQVEDRTQQMQYLSTCLQQFLMECCRTQATLNNTVIQSDQEALMALLKMTATGVGNIAVRQSPAYSSQTKGSVERFHRTLLGQVRAPKLQLENNYGTHLTSKHPIMPWMVKHAAYLLNRHAIHADGNTSYVGTKNTRHQFVSLVKEYSTCYQQQQSTGLRWKHASFRPSGLAKTPQQTRTFLESANRLSKQGQPGDNQNQGSTTSR